MEFTDDIYKRILIDEGGKITNAHMAVYQAKRDRANNGKLQYVDFSQMENGYQCFRRKHPQYPEYSFRRFVWIRYANKGHVDVAEKIFNICRWPALTQEQLDEVK